MLLIIEIQDNITTNITNIIKKQVGWRNTRAK